MEGLAYMKEPIAGSDAGTEGHLMLGRRRVWSSVHGQASLSAYFQTRQSCVQAKEGIVRLRRSSEDYEKRIEQMAENDLYDSYKQKHGAAIENKAQKDVEEEMRQNIR
ncbi:hypothetical protein HO133_006576 [Letharia lupina]|uniref:Uncharacterized protein n=1 Tax=Letharia lupina TaxID=560253 RepID=A0A8H6C6Y3_9LECA|nr:uncharacterized protein HO133_006576 [Letharia lupina]KAF6217749.1 hypothetical protein HO133_006576 [Letharia lupina]